MAKSPPSRLFIGLSLADCQFTTADEKSHKRHGRLPKQGYRLLLSAGVFQKRARRFVWTASSFSCCYSRLTRAVARRSPLLSFSVLLPTYDAWKVPDLCGCGLKHIPHRFSNIPQLTGWVSTLCLRLRQCASGRSFSPLAKSGARDS